MMHKHKLKWQRLPGHRNLKGRAGHTATLVGKDIYVLGGRNGNEFFNDMWVFDMEAEQWKLVQAKTPFSPRAYHTCTLINDQELWVIGGSDPKTMYSDVHVFDTVSLKWSNPSTPSMKPRGTHSAVVHPLKKKAILIFGGYGGSKSSWMNDLIVFHTDTSKCDELKPEGARPLGRGYHTLTAFGNCVALFGGKAEGGIINEDKLSIYDAAANRWSMVPVKGEPPSPRSNHASTLTGSGFIIIHGGRHGSLRLNDCYLLQVPTMCSDGASLDLRWHLIERPETPTVMKKTSGKRSLEMTKADLPIGRSAHSLISHGQALYIFGGYGGEGLTFADMFVLRKLPKLPELEVEKQTFVKVADKLLIEVTDTIEDGGGEEEKEEGWRNTKHLKLHSKKQVDGLLDSANGQGIQLHQRFGAAGFCKEKSNMTSDTKSTEPIRDNSWPQETRVVTSFEDRSLTTLVQEKEFYQKEVRSLQQSLDTLRATIKEKTLVDLDCQRKSLQLEQELQRLQKENLEHQSTIKEFEKEATHQSKKVRKLEQENNFFKAELQNGKCLLEERENAQQMVVLKMNELEKKLQDVCKSYEESKAAASEAVLERDKYKSCVKALETELEKQMDALRQVSLRFEGEKAFLLKEITERKGIADKMLTELGASKECLRSLEEKNDHQVKQIEQESAKLAILQEEKEALACSKAVLTSENKQLIEAKQAAEDNCTLLRSELQTSRASAEQHKAEAVRLKEKVEQTREHTSALHESLKKMEEKFNLQLEENNKIRSLLRETEDFEQAQVRLMQAHMEKLRCARQSYFKNAQ
eukprot:c17857_g1_i1 orf=135-2555(+)